MTDGTQGLLAQIAAVIEERDGLRARNQELDALCRRQGVVIAKLAETMAELQAFLDETQLIVAPAPEGPAANAPKAEPAKGKSARRYTDEDAREWASALRQGKTQSEVAETYGVSTNTIKARLERLGYNPRTGCLEEEPDPEVESDAPAAGSDDGRLHTHTPLEEEADDAPRPFDRPTNGNGADAATYSSTLPSA